MTAAEQRELRELVERYAQAVDRADGSGVAALFTDDGILAVPASTAPTGERRGHADIAAAVDGIGRYVATHHTISSHSSHVDGLHATGETLCTAHHVTEDDGLRRDRVLYIRYLDTYTRDDVVARREVRVQWTSTLPVD